MWRFPPNRLLVAVDFGEASLRALRVAGELARTFDAEVAAIHAETFEAPPYFTREQVHAIEEQRRAAGREAARFLERTASKTAGVPVRPIVTDATPAEAILHASRDYDLVVMGTHGRRGPARWWAGSVAERVARETTVPVLIVRAGSDDVPKMFSAIATVAPAGVFDDSARRYARGLADRFHGSYAPESTSVVTDEVAHDATLVIVAQPGAHTPALAVAAAERTLRTCQRPVLLVPPV